MELINYVFAVFVSFFGLLVGMLLSFYTKEELKEGKKYFLIIQKVILAGIFYFLLVNFSINLTSSLMLTVIFLVLLFILDYKKHTLTYLVLGVVLALTKDGIVFSIVASLVFIYGLPVGTLISYELRKKRLETFLFIIKKYLIFVLVALILYFVF